jgi:hypothetical protein
VRAGLPVSAPVPWDDLPALRPRAVTVTTASELIGAADTWGALLPEPQELPPGLVADGHAIPVARVAAMHEGKRRARARREDPEA